jgi:hypothetical protein
MTRGGFREKDHHCNLLGELGNKERKNRRKKEISWGRGITPIIKICQSDLAWSAGLRPHFAYDKAEEE